MKRYYNPSIPGQVTEVIREQLVCFLYLIIAALPYLWDIIYTSWVQSEESRLPNSVADLLDPKMFSKLSGRNVVKVEYSVRLEQHANSTDRAWFKVQYSDDDEDSFVFAKTQAKNFLVSSLMSMFDVYRNELDTYATVKMPVRTPKVHICKWTKSRFVLAMEDLRHLEVEFPNIWETHVDKSLAKSVLTTIATVHAKFWNNAPSGAWNDKTRPYLPKTQGLITLYNVRRKCPELIPDDIFDLYVTAMWNFDSLRQFYSRPGSKTMVHGDCHMGNFFITKDRQVGTFDFQCRAEEHCMRDVTYFLMSSYPEDTLASDEKELINFYREQLVALGVPHVPSEDECWLQYRLQSFYTMYAFVFSGGFSDLMDPLQTRYGLKRIVRQMKRVDARGALYDLLDGTI